MAERVAPGDKPEWLEEKRVGAARDPRLNAGSRSGDGGRLLLSEAVRTMKKATLEDWPLKGPSAAKEVLDGIRATGMEPPAYCAHYVQVSGIKPSSGLYTEFKNLISLLWMFVCHDRLDAHNCATAELLCRRIVMIQRVVRTNPRSPDFEGLECFMANALDASGGIVTSDFEGYVADIQRNEAQVMKQQRLAREEAEAADKRKRVQKGGGGPGGGGGSGAGGAA